jgi:DNA-binding transcriptional MerR regulator
MPIGVFARRSGLTPSALRFYADSGLLRPARVDPVTGYRSYGADQLPRAAALRGLRAIGMPLTDAAVVLDAGPGEASRLIDEHIAKVVGDAATARRDAAVVKSALAGVPYAPIAALKGPVLAGAVDQVMTAAAHEPGAPVLGGLRIEVSAGAVTLTATDRYRLSTRSLVPVEAGTDWAATIDGGELRAAVPDIRRSALVRVDAAAHTVRLRLAGGQDRHCTLLPQQFPDHRLMLASLDDVTTRVTVAKEPFLRALEDHATDRVDLRVTARGMSVVETGAHGREGDHPAAVTGHDLRVSFDLTTLYPAVSTAIGPDVMLDLRGTDRPATVRSADRGDLTTVAMPVKPGPSD